MHRIGLPTHNPLPCSQPTLIRNIFRGLTTSFIAAGLVLLVAGPLSARPLTQEEKLADFHQLVSLIHTQYGPLQFKAQAKNINLDQLKNSYSQKILQTATNGQFYYLLNRFVAEFRDSHFSSSLPTTLTASLPFTVDLVAGKVLIDTINRDLLPEKTFPFVRGDEVVMFSGRPVAEVVGELSAYFGMGYEETAKRMATMALTMRSGTRLPVPKGEVNIQVRRGGSNLMDSATLAWKVTGAAVDEDDPNRGLQQLRLRFDDLSIFDELEVVENRQTERSFRCSGGTRIEIPKDATVLMMTPFVAYFHPTAKGNVGYLRIPHYYPKNEVTGADEFDLRFKQYEWAIANLEQHTVGLVIDQDHNCGGSVDYLHRIVSLFMSKSFEPMQFRLLGTKEFYLEFSKWLTEATPNTIEFENLAGVLGLIKSAWDQGDFMTPKTSIDGTPAIAPHSVRYTKPIVMLVDEMSGSGGDAFPSLMQGYGRAKLLGTRTMGAGGHVQQMPPLYNSQLVVRLTRSLFYRPDGVEVENNGAVPDVAYAPTREDFMYGYRNYQSFYLSELFKLLP